MVRVLSQEFPPGGDAIPVVDYDGLPPAVPHNTEAGLADLAQYEVSDSEAGSSSSFEVLLPDFSSLGLSEVKQPDPDTSREENTTTREKRSSTPDDDPRNVNKRWSNILFKKKYFMIDKEEPAGRCDIVVGGEQKTPCLPGGEHSIHQ